MQNYHVRLESPVSESYRCVRAANSLDIDAKKKSVHELNIRADLSGDYNLLLIVGASGSGKTTLARQIFGDACFKEALDLSKPVIEQFPESLSYDQCAELLCGIGLTSVPCWIRPAYTLSNGQRARAEAALSLISNDGSVVIDEWTSVVDRTVAKVMSHCVQKFARKNKKKVTLLSCHYDVIEWLDPDLIIDCNTAEFIDRRLLPREDRARREKIRFGVRKVSRATWPMFSKYHYLSDRLPGGLIESFGIFHGDNQIGYLCFAEYIPRKKPWHKRVMHFNRLVIHPDYAGFGLGLSFVNACSYLMEKRGFEVWGKFSSIPVYKALSKSPYWACQKISKLIGSKHKQIMGARRETIRSNLTTFSFRFKGISDSNFVNSFRSDLDGLELNLEHLICP